MHDQQEIYDNWCYDCHSYSYNPHDSNWTSGRSLPGTINLAGSFCSGCHTSGMNAGVPQIVVANHPDPAIAHAGIVTPSCTECHSSDVIGLHPTLTCAQCHTQPLHAGATCASCHPTYVNPHGDYTAAHLAVWEPECANQCHGADLVAAHNGDCAACHPEGGPNPAAGTTCFTCHETYHTNSTSTPASSPWTLALIAVVGLAAVPVIRRAKSA